MAWAKAWHSRAWGFFAVGVFEFDVVFLLFLVVGKVEFVGGQVGAAFVAVEPELEVFVGVVVVQHPADFED